MGNANTARLGLLTLSVVLAASGCATITRGGTQSIPITSSPTGAAVSVDGQARGATPLLIGLPRKTKGHVIRIESPGYDPVEIRLRREMSSGPVLGNILMGSILGLLPAAGWAGANAEDPHANTDRAYLIWGLGTAVFVAVFTGIDALERGFQFQPTELVVTLTRSAGPPRVDTVFLSPDDLRNVKWIRVRRD